MAVPPFETCLSPRPSRFCDVRLAALERRLCLMDIVGVVVVVLIVLFVLGYFGRSRFRA